MSVAEGDMAPAFEMPASGGRTVSLAGSLAGLEARPFVLYFYPKADTPGCTKQACGFRDKLGDLSKKGIEVVGVSGDTVASHKLF